MARRLASLSVAFVALVALSAYGQIATPNAAGVSMGHVHFNVTNVDAEKKFWVEQGGRAVKIGRLEAVSFPGVYFIFNAQMPSGNSAGSIVDHVGFLSKDGKAVVAKWTALGTPLEVNGRGTGGFFYTRDGVRAEIPERPSIESDMVFDQLHFFPPTAVAMAEMQAWYAKHLGASPGTPGGGVNTRYEEQLIPGVHLRFTVSATPRVATKGRALDHIGFEVTNLKVYCEKLAGMGIKFDAPYAKHPELGVAAAVLTDPWGTSIELTEPLGQK